MHTSIANQLKMKNAQSLVQSFPLSKGYLNDLQKIRDEKLNAEVIQISKNSLRNFIEITPTEMKSFIAAETNLKRLQSIPFYKAKPISLKLKTLLKKSPLRILQKWQISILKIHQEKAKVVT